MVCRDLCTRFENRTTRLAARHSCRAKRGPRVGASCFGDESEGPQVRAVGPVVRALGPDHNSAPVLLTSPSGKDEVLTVSWSLSLESENCLDLGV